MEISKVSQTDFYGEFHSPSFTINFQKLFDFIRQVNSSDSTLLEEIDYLEFESFYRIPSGLIGVDIDMTDILVVDMIYIKRTDPKHPDIYFLHSNPEGTINLSHFDPDGVMPKTPKGFENIFLEFLNQGALRGKSKYLDRIKEVSREEIPKVIDNTPFLNFLNCNTYFF